MTIYQLIYTVLEFVFGDMITGSLIVGGLCEIFSVIFCFSFVFLVFVSPLFLVLGIFKRKKVRGNEK